MKTCFRIFLPLLATLLLLSGSANATYIYTYETPPFERTSGDYLPTDRLIGTVEISEDAPIVLTVRGLLGDGEGPHEPKPAIQRVVAWSFTDGHQVLTEANSIGEFLFSVHAIQGTLGRDPETFAWVELRQPGGGGIEIRDPRWADPAGLFIRSSAGAAFSWPSETWWSLQPTPVPEPATLALVSAGLVALGTGVWRRLRAT